MVSGTVDGTFLDDRRFEPVFAAAMCPSGTRTASNSPTPTSSAC
jgi:hypothetical protein